MDPLHTTLGIYKDETVGSEEQKRSFGSGFLCSMIPCLSIVECMHQGDDINVVIVLELGQNCFLLVEDNRRTLA